MNLDYTGKYNPYGLIQKQMAGKSRMTKKGRMTEKSRRTRCRRHCKCRRHSCKFCGHKRRRTRKNRRKN